MRIGLLNYAKTLAHPRVYWNSHLTYFDLVFFSFVGKECVISYQ